MKKNLIRTTFGIFILFFITTTAYPQWIKTNWKEGNSFFELYSNQDTVFARIWDTNNGGRVFFTDDDGLNWTQISSAEDDIDILSIVMLDNTILAGTWDGFYRCNLEEPYWNWELFDTVGISQDSHIWSIAKIDDILFANTGSTIYQSSIDNINEWAEVSVGIPISTRIKSFIANGNAIFAGSTSLGIFIITDSETDWTAVNSGLTDLRISQLAAVENKLFAVTKQDGVFLTDSNGLDWISDANSITWEPYNSGLENINCLLDSNTLLFAGTDSNGVYLSPDAGLTWMPFNTGMPDSIRIWSLAIIGDNIFAATNEGIWKRNPAGINKYTITASALEGGSISPEGDVTVYETSFQKFTITPSQGYAISDVLVDGNSVGAVSTYTFTNISENHTITASFFVAPHTITASAGDGGIISPSGAFAVATGSSHTFTITPSDGYEITDVLVDGVSVGVVTSYTFSSISSDHTIAVFFSSFIRYQINCGGDASAPFAADQYYSSGVDHSVDKDIDMAAVTDPAPREVYQTQRYYETMTYTFPDLTSGTSYIVRLHFSENILGKEGFRRFNVNINGTEVLSNFDIYAETGARYKAAVKEFITTANTSDQIVIQFKSVNYYATIGGIEIIKQ